MRAEKESIFIYSKIFPKIGLKATIVFNLWITRSVRNNVLWALRYANVSLRCGRFRVYKPLISQTGFNNAGSREFGLLLLRSSWLPCFGIGVISAVFYTSGNVEDKRVALMIDVMKGSVINRLSVRTRVCILSITGALLEGVAFMTSATCLQST